MIVLAGDVGGTKARLATVELNGGGARIMHQRVYRSCDYPALAPLVCGFCRELPSVPRRACFGLARPVVDQECTATNLPWTVAVGTLGEAILTVAASGKFSSDRTIAEYAADVGHVEPCPVS